MKFVRVAFASSTLFALTSAALGQAHPVIRITVINYSSFDASYDLFDAVCQTASSLDLVAWERREINVCSSGVHNEGYGTIQYKKSLETAWTESALLVEGDTVNF